MHDIIVKLGGVPWPKKDTTHALPYTFNTSRQWSFIDRVDCLLLYRMPRMFGQKIRHNSPCDVNYSVGMECTLKKMHVLWKKNLFHQKISFLMTLKVLTTKTSPPGAFFWDHGWRNTKMETNFNVQVVSFCGGSRESKILLFKYKVCDYL